jgi:hypothetical protein
MKIRIAFVAALCAVGFLCGSWGFAAAFSGPMGYHAGSGLTTAPEILVQYNGGDHGQVHKVVPKKCRPPLKYCQVRYGGAVHWECKPPPC